MAATPPSRIKVLDCICYETLRQYGLRLPEYDLIRRKHGRRVADRKCAPTGAGVITIYPLQRVEFDHFLVDVYVKVKINGKYYRQRPWLTLGVDHFTGAIVAFYLSLSPPSSISVLAALRSLIAPSEQRLSRIPAHGVVFAGIPDTIAVDNGLDLTSKAVSDACYQAGIEILYMPPRQPRFKGTVERTGGTINTRFIHWLPGTTLGKAMKDLQYDASAHALLTFEQLEERLLEYIDLHNQTPRRTKPGTPAKRWASGIERVPARIPMSHEEFDAAIALTYQKSVNHQGVGFEGLYYNNTQLWHVWQRLPNEKKKRKQKLTVRINPLDLRYIYVFDPATNTPFRVDCTYELPYPPTLDYHRAVNQVMKDENADLHDVRARNKAARTLRENIQRDADESKKRTLRGKKASLAQAVEKAKEIDEQTFGLKSTANNAKEFDDILKESREDPDD